MLKHAMMKTINRKMTGFQVLAAALMVVSAMSPSAVFAQSINAGLREAVAENPFNIREVAAFNTPWAIAVLPDQRLLVTEKAGHIFVVDQAGVKTEISNVPAVAFERAEWLAGYCSFTGFFE